MDTMTRTPAARRVEELTARLRFAREALDKATRERDAVEARDASRHWTETDTAAGSGIRRKPNPKADARRFARQSRESAVYAEVDKLAGEVALLERRVEVAEQERDRARLTRADVVGAQLVRTRHGWHKVAKVNRTTVSVETGYSWTDRIEFDRILEVRP